MSHLHGIDVDVDVEHHVHAEKVAVRQHTRHCMPCSGHEDAASCSEAACIRLPAKGKGGGGGVTFVKLLSIWVDCEYLEGVVQ